MSSNHKQPRSNRFRWLKWVASGVVVVCLLIALFYVVENRRGKREWLQTKTELEAMGISFDWADYVPQPIADEHNFAATPAIAYFQYEADDPNHKPWNEAWGDEAHLDDIFAMKEGGPHGSASILLDGAQAWHESRFEPNEKRRQQLRKDGLPIVPDGVDPWQQLESLIAPHQQLLQELRDAAQERSQSYIHGDYASNPMAALSPDFRAVRQYMQLLFADALLAIQSGDKQTALQNAYCIKRMGNLSPNFLTLVNHMIGVVFSKFEITIYQLALQQGLLDETELKRLIEESLQPHPLADFERAIIYEIVATTESFFNNLNASMFFLSTLMDPTLWDKTIDLLWRRLINAMPEGWYYQMASRYARYTLLILEPYQTESRKLQLDILKKNQKILDQIYADFNFFELLAAIALPGFERIINHTLMSQCQQDMLGIACALELYKLANDDLPVSLDLLQPDFIPELRNDPVNGEAYRYERIDNHRYRLWGVGMNGVDDGGVIDAAADDHDQPDIVWALFGKI